MKTKINEWKRTLQSVVKEIQKHPDLIVETHFTNTVQEAKYYIENAIGEFDDALNQIDDLNK